MRMHMRIHVPVHMQRVCKSAGACWSHHRIDLVDLAIFVRYSFPKLVDLWLRLGYFLQLADHAI